jgi:hydroxymethylpyrimidine pyrophosphatase-like HAD family hydrolase
MPLGTPQDVAIFLGKHSEYNTTIPKTLFIDLDGTILRHTHVYSELDANKAKLLPGVQKKMNEWDSLGHKIILVSARKESARKITEQCLERLGIPYDFLLLGITGGERYLINDKLKLQSKDRAVALNLITDSDFNKVEWEKIGL